MYENLLDGTTWRIDYRQSQAREEFRRAGGHLRRHPAPRRHRVFGPLLVATHALRHG